MRWASSVICSLYTMSLLMRVVLYGCTWVWVTIIISMSSWPVDRIKGSQQRATDSMQMPSQTYILLGGGRCVEVVSCLQHEVRVSAEKKLLPSDPYAPIKHTSLNSKCLCQSMICGEMKGKIQQTQICNSLYQFQLLLFSL